MTTTRPRRRRARTKTTPPLRLFWKLNIERNERKKNSFLTKNLSPLFCPFFVAVENKTNLPVCLNRKKKKKREKREKRDLDRELEGLSLTLQRETKKKRKEKERDERKRKISPSRSQLSLPPLPSLNTDFSRNLSPSSRRTRGTRRRPGWPSSSPRGSCRRRPTLRRARRPRAGRRRRRPRPRGRRPRPRRP